MVRYSVIIAIIVLAGGFIGASRASGFESQSLESNGPQGFASISVTEFYDLEYLYRKVNFFRLTKEQEVFTVSSIDFNNLDWVKKSWSPKCTQGLVKSLESGLKLVNFNAINKMASLLHGEDITIQSYEVNMSYEAHGYAVGFDTKAITSKGSFVMHTPIIQGNRYRWDLGPFSGCTFNIENLALYIEDTMVELLLEGIEDKKDYEAPVEEVVGKKFRVANSPSFWNQQSLLPLYSLRGEREMADMLVEILGKSDISKSHFRVRVSNKDGKSDLYFGDLRLIQDTHTFQVADPLGTVMRGFDKNNP